MAAIPARKSVAILIPVSDSIPGLFLSHCIKAFVSMLQLGWPTHIITSDKVPIDQARQELLEKALANSPHPDYLLWLDSDMLVEPSHIQSLVNYLENEPSVDAASGLYFKKRDLEPVCFLKDGEKVKLFMPPTMEPTEVDAVGMGCMLMRTSAVTVRLAPLMAEKKSLFKFDSMSEDVNFCLLLRNAGAKIMVLPSVEVPHLGGTVVRWQHDRKP